MTINQLNQYAINELSKYDSFVDTSSFDRAGKLMKVWNDAHAELVIKYFLPEFVLSQLGFCQGDASDEEILKIEKRLKTDNIFAFLDNEFVNIVIPKLETLIDAYENKYESKINYNDL